MAIAKKVKSVGRSGKEGFTKGQRERHWQRIIRQWELSGQTQAQFCQEQSISRATFGWWRSELKRRRRKRSEKAKQQRGRSNTKSPRQRRSGKTDQKSKSVSFVPVEIASPSCDNFPKAPLEIILCNQRRIRVGSDFDASALEQLVALLERL